MLKIAIRIHVQKVNTQRMAYTKINWKLRVVKQMYTTNNNNYKTSIVPISQKRIELSGAPNIGVGQTDSPGTIQNSSTYDQMEWKLRKDKQV